MYPAPKKIFHFSPNFDRFQQIPYWILKELILGWFFLQILGPNFERTYLKDHEELAAHIKHACRVGGYTPARTKKFHMMCTQTAHTPKFSKNCQNRRFGAEIRCGGVCLWVHILSALFWEVKRLHWKCIILQSQLLTPKTRSSSSMRNKLYRNRYQLFPQHLCKSGKSTYMDNQFSFKVLAEIVVKSLFLD